MKTEVDYKEFKYPDLENHTTKLKEILEEIDTNIDSLLKVEDKDYHNFYVPYNMLFEDVSKHNFYLSHINSTKNNDTTQEVNKRNLPILSEWSTQNSQREDIYGALQEVLKSDLTKAQKREVEESILSKKLSGIGMEEDLKNKISKINLKLSELSNDFSNNILKATKEYKLVITDPEDVREFPEDELPRHKKGDVWEFNLQAPSYSAYMRYGSNSDLRKELHEAYLTRAPENEEIIEEILTLRKEKSNLLGYKDYSEISFLTKMVNGSDQVFNFLNTLKDKSLPISEKEDRELKDFVKSEYNIDTLNPWDKSYYINKYKEKNFDFKPEELKPYFEQSNVLNGMFNFLNDKFNLEFKEVEDTYIWDEKVKVYDITRNSKEHSRVYFDLESRGDKSGGAWMNNSETGYEWGGEKRVPVAYVTCNFTPSTDDLPSLLTHDEVLTLWHEMGHVLQHICSEVKDPILSGINGVEWDAVEWSSQFLELFTYEKDILERFAHHYQTNEVIPYDLIDKINIMKNYRIGNSIKRQVEFGLFDMEIHTSDDTSKENIQNILNNIREGLSVETIPNDKFQNGFAHIFSGGYSAGYYSYKWAEVLSIDTYLRFREENDFDKYYNEFLSKGSSLTSMEMFENYMGRKPNENSLIDYYFNDNQKIRLPDNFINQLIETPENGMGFHIVDLHLKNGVLKNKIVLNNSILTLESSFKMNINEIELITISD